MPNYGEEMTEDKNMGVRDQRKEEKVIKSYGTHMLQNKGKSSIL
jgi:hypothetical protein